MNKIVTFILFIATFLFWYMVYPNHISNQVYFSLFETTPSYFLYHCKFPGGVAEWCGAFISQFYRWVFIGALIQTLLVSLLYLAIVKNKIFDGVVKIKQAWGLFPVVLLFLLQTQYSFLAENSLQVVLWFAFFCGYSRIEKEANRWLVALLFCYPAIMIFGALPSIIWLVCVILFEIYKSSLWWRNVSIALVGLVCIGIWHYGFPLDTSHWITFFPQQREFILPKTAWALYLSLAVFLVILIASKYEILKMMPLSLKWNWLITLTVLVGLLYFGKTELYYPQVEQLLGLQKAAIEEDWETILEADQSLSKKTIASYVLTNLALAHTGMLAERAFDYPQIGMNGLMYGPEKDYFGMLCSSWIYDWLGVKNEAFHWSIETSVTQGNNTSPFLMKQIASLLIQMDKQSVAAKYLKRLIVVPFYSDWARENLKRTTRVDYLRKIKISDPLHLDTNVMIRPNESLDFFVGQTGPFYDLFQLGERYPQNKQVRDYLLMSMLFEKDVATFYDWFKRYYPAGYSENLPRLYREALIIVGVSKLDSEVNKKYRISNDDIQKFKLYMDRCRIFENDKKTASSLLLKEYGNTFWYYMHFM